ncbi:hypothetical protein EYF80_020971 [Liparis tanakae]|uniref:Uncharacterized protein n=1 Tax=Liparis tanakae TaxID=230148 RepID=A0A4Z2HUZ4_9TELE|nr:hypothetical protein EYF80_020971 [Liparis tanakae]
MTSRSPLGFQWGISTRTSRKLVVTVSVFVNTGNEMCPSSLCVRQACQGCEAGAPTGCDKAERRMGSFEQTSVAATLGGFSQSRTPRRGPPVGGGGGYVTTATFTLEMLNGLNS